jgi:hypothetical protein
MTIDKKVALKELDGIMKQEGFERAGLELGDYCGITFLDTNADWIDELRKKNYSQIRLLHYSILSEEGVRKIYDNTYLKPEYIVYVKK